MKKYLLLFFAGILFSDCSDKCQDSALPPPSYFIDIVDASTNENVFATNTYSSVYIDVFANGENNVYFDFIGAGFNYIHVIPPDQSNGLYIWLSEDKQIPITYITQSTVDDCNDYYTITDLETPGNTSEFFVDSEGTIVLRIKI